MFDEPSLRRVARRGLRVCGLVIPSVFFRHGQPGRRFAVFPKDRGRLTHVRAADLDAIVSAYREYASTRRPRPSPMRRRSAACLPNSPVALGAQGESAREGAGPSEPPDPAEAAVAAGRIGTEALAQREREELDRVNALAVHLVALKTRLGSAGRALTDKGLQRLQEQHSRHLERCLRLRSLLAGPGPRVEGRAGRIPDGLPGVRHWTLAT